MSPLNTEKIQTLISECRKALAQLTRLAEVPRDELLSSDDRLGNLKYQFIIAIESAIDICQHVSAKRFNALPDSYAECFSVLEKEGVIEPGLCSEMADLARFRNLLVHLYWRVDNNRVIEKLEKLSVIELYLQRLAHYSGLV